MSTLSPASPRLAALGRAIEIVCDRLAQAALVLILSVILASIVLGVIAIVTWPSFPILGAGPGGANGIPAILLMVATGMGAPSLLLALFHLLRGEWSKLGRALPFFGPAFLFFGFFFVSHAFDPCGFGFTSFQTMFLGSPLCQHWGGGLEIHTRFHLLHHAVIPTVFLVGLYWMSLRRWHPAVTQVGFRWKRGVQPS